MAPKYTLTYFNLKAMAEPIRLLLSYSNIEFEDKRISFEDWPKFKLTTPAGQLPLLQVDDKVLYQSGAICRYLAKQCGLAGSNDWEAMEIDIAIDTVHDMRLKLVNAFYESDAAVKEKKLKALMAEDVPNHLKRLEKIATLNKGHLALGKLTWADFLFTGIVDYLSHISSKDILAGSPNLTAVVDNVKSLPAIKAWYAKAPKCDF